MSRTAEDWDESAGEYDRFENKWHYYDRVAQGLVRQINARRSSRVLELASGTGACTLVLASKFKSGSVTCVERSEGMMDLARKNIDRAGVKNVALVKGDVSNLSELIDGLERFDLALCNSALWQFPEPLKIMKAVRRSLKPGSSFAFNVPARFTGGGQVDRFRKVLAEVRSKHGLGSQKTRRWATTDEYKALLKRAGFSRVKIGRYTLTMDPKEREEWRSIPAFSRSWGWTRNMPPDVVKEVRAKARKLGLSPWRPPQGNRSVWTYLVATTKARRRARD